MVAQRLAPLPHSEKVLVPGTFLRGVSMFSLSLCGFSGFLSQSEKQACEVNWELETCPSCALPCDGRESLQLTPVTFNSERNSY